MEFAAAAGRNKPLAGTQLWFLAYNGLGFGNSQSHPATGQTDRRCPGLQQRGISINSKITAIWHLCEQ